MEKIEPLKKVTMNIPEHHRWTRGVRGLGLLIEALLDKNFEGEFSESLEENEIIAAKNIIKAQKLIDGVRKRRREEKEEAKKILLSRKLKKSQKKTEPYD